MSPTELLQRLEGLDVDSADLAVITDAHHTIRALRGRLDSIEARLTRRATVLHEQTGGTPPEDVLVRAGRRSRRDAERARRRAELLADAPSLDDALSAGRIGHEHADVVAAAAGRLDERQRRELLEQEAELTEAATASTPEAFRRFVRRTVDQLDTDAALDRAERQRTAARLSFRLDHETGMGRIHGELDPESFQRIRRAVDAETHALRKLPENEGVPAERVAVSALVNLTTGARSTIRRNRAEVVVHIDHQTLLEGLHERSVCEYADGSPLPPETTRRLACDAGIIPLVLGSDGLALDVGRTSRLATSAQRTALRAMYRTCAIDGCDRAFSECEIHHLIDWYEGSGETDLANLLPLCSHHHHRAHEGRWRLQLDPTTRVLTVELPDGSRHGRCPPDLVAERTAGIAA